jgi:hypothetical protein
MRETLDELDGVIEVGGVQALLPDGEDRASLVLNAAVETFSRFHSRRALAFEDWRILVDPKLCLYYGNRVSAVAWKGAVGS